MALTTVGTFHMTAAAAPTFLVRVRCMRMLLIAIASTAIAGSTLAAQARLIHATGTFDVTLVPQADADSAVGRMSIDKKFHGDLEGASKGTMLASMTAIPNSAGYVAIEKVTGTLHGKRGSFALQHSGTMNRGAQSLTITVVPDSGTDELAGISGSMKIIIEGKEHSYEFEYTIAKAP
jgi:hypothetical protein